MSTYLRMCFFFCNFASQTGLEPEQVSIDINNTILWQRINHLQKS